ncbi:GNAT family N-acetyltransferase [Marivita sp. XM-24bin2]|jgi:phosphinothricin acetyltransferase|uniref:GNAT family N-acetyltransferase n=1 Tax=unclassified Marivita TaxID=2632480 RepID=UPI000D7956C3|nr:GNAT family N-acetyltransferase [Marivita sp. XM-24bin2]MCR9107524.1 GNAT family N-acetyltransferase [Paracoccaceae bacterium]PWL35113.1 MAG: GNAT family N-acetyltransferase [Marivita sp. XM-24bin2]
MIIRPARAEDAEALTAILNDVIDNTTITFTSKRKTVEDVQSDIAAKGAAFLVVEIDGVAAGYASYFPFRNGPGYARTKEHSIALAQHARGKGAGRALMQVLEEVARADGVHSLWAGISAENMAGRYFHATLGFTEIATLPEVGFKFDRWIDLVLMQKML